MKTLHISIVDKIATYQKRDGDIVCGNSGYQIKFTFDSEWESRAEKTARFIWNGQYFDVEFTGDTCDVPIVRKTTELQVGVYAGDLVTTTPAKIGCKASILCGSDKASVENDGYYANEAKEAAERAAEEAREEVVRIIGELGIVQTTGDSESAVMSQKATSDNINAILGAFETAGSENLLNPNNAENGYYDIVDGVLKKVSNASCKCTVTPIPVKGGSTLYFASNIGSFDGSAVIAIFELDENDNYIGKFAFSFKDISSGAVFNQSVNLRTAKIHIHVNDKQSFDNICVSQHDITEYEQYSWSKTPLALKSSMLPDDFVVQTTGDSETAVMSQKAVTEALNERNILEVVQTTGYSETEVMSQKAVTNTFTQVFDFTDNKNLLNPENSEAGYYEATVGGTLEPKTSRRHIRTTMPITVDSGKTLYIKANIPDGVTVTDQIIWLMHLDENGLCVSTDGGGRWTAVMDGSAEPISIAEGTKMVHIYIGVGELSDIDFSNFCISFEPLEEFEPYTDGINLTGLKPKALPKSTLADIEETKQKAEEAALTALERDLEMFIPTNIMDAVTTTVGSIWASFNTLASTAATKIYTAINEAIEVIPCAEYLFQEGQYLVRFYDENGTQVQNELNIKSYAGGTSDGKVITPEGAYQMRVSYRHDVTSALGFGIFRMTPTPEELEQLPLRKDKFVVKPQNIADKSVIALISPLKGKVIVNFGDSIFGNYRPPNDVSTFLAERTGATVHNCGFGGCRMSSHHIANFDAFGMANIATAITTQNFTVQDNAITAGKTAATEAEGKLPSYFEATLDLLKTIDFSKVDIITIAYGTNDFASSKALENEENQLDITKFGGALRYSIETILSAFPHIKVFICSQLYRFWMDSEGEFVEDSDTKITSANLKLTDFVSKTKEIAKAYHLPFIDNYYELGINKFNRSVYFPATDGTHPNPVGRELLASHIASELY